MHKLVFYQTKMVAPRIVPGEASRVWMDSTPERFAYRCLPLRIANSMGWEVLAPCEIRASWNGGLEKDDLTVQVEDPAWQPDRIASSHFGSGILTFHIGYVVRTDAGIGVWARGAPNMPKDGVSPLEGIIETDWLSFTFTMNWKFTRPCSVVFEKDEPICFLTPIGYGALKDIAPEIVPIEESPQLNAEFMSWADQRREFNRGLLAEEPAIVEQAWQKWYTRGETPTGERRNPDHLSKLSLQAPTMTPRRPDPD